LLLSSTAISALNPNGVDRKVVPIAFPGTLTPGTYYVGVIADHTAQVAESNEANNASSVIPMVLGSAAANALAGSAGADIIYALGGNDVINGGADRLAARQRQDKISQRPAAKMERAPQKRNGVTARRRLSVLPRRQGKFPQRHCKNGTGSGAGSPRGMPRFPTGEQVRAERPG
jgi:Ca2+-binding RTX toxin-like protein